MPNAARYTLTIHTGKNMPAQQCLRLLGELMSTEKLSDHPMTTAIDLFAGLVAWSTDACAAGVQVLWAINHHPFEVITNGERVCGT